MALDVDSLKQAIKRHEQMNRNVGFERRFQVSLVSFDEIREEHFKLFYDKGYKRSRVDLENVSICFYKDTIEEHKKLIDNIQEFYGCIQVNGLFY